MNDQRSCPTYLIPDAPNQEDQFGAHRRLANAIADLILSKEEKGGKTIGIEGNYGSGKSTVVNLLEKLLKPNKEIAVIFIDAWAHEGDPLRRTFLESIIKSLRDKEGWIKNDEWIKREAELARRRKITDKTSYPQLSTFGTFSAINVLFIPISIALLNNALKKGFSFNFINGLINNYEFGFEGIIGFALSINPLLLYFVFKLFLYLDSRMSPQVRKWLNSRLPNRWIA